MSKKWKNLLSVFLILCFCAFVTGCDSEETKFYADGSVDDGSETTTLHLSEVPDGYIGIYNADDLVRSGINENGNYILMNDIDLSDYSDWEWIRNHSIFDGNGYTISNLTSSKGSLFAVCNDVQNLSLENVNISVESDYHGWGIGAITSILKGNMYNCSASGTIKFSCGYDYDSFSGTEIGGLVGEIEGENSSISYCTNRVNVTTNSEIITDVGGIVGYANFGTSIIKNCKNYGNISTQFDNNQDVGGICGFIGDDETIIGCSNYGKIETIVNINPEYYNEYFPSHPTIGIGGITGHSYSKSSISYCSNLGNIQVNAIAFKGKLFIGIGGILGFTEGTINIWNCYNISNLSINSEITENTLGKVGAILGYSEKGANISYCAYYGYMGLNIDGDGAMFANCKSMSKEDMQDIKNYPFDSTGWENSEGEYPYPVYIEEPLDYIY